MKCPNDLEELKEGAKGFFWCWNFGRIIAMTQIEVSEGKCPNRHGDLMFFNHPIDILYHIPVELMDDFEGKDTPPGMFGYIAAICQKCGFTLSLKRIDGLHDYLSWLKEYRSSGEIQ